jgi:small redox-active disulfide protein 2
MFGLDSGLYRSDDFLRRYHKKEVRKMKKIQILGTGCPKCMKLTANAQEAAKQAGIEFEIEKVTEINKIMNYGVMMTPALAIDGQVKSVGKVLSPEEIKKLL